MTRVTRLVNVRMMEVMRTEGWEEEDGGQRSWSALGVGGWRLPGVGWVRPGGPTTASLRRAAGARRAGP